MPLKFHALMGILMDKDWYVLRVNDQKFYFAKMSNQQ